MTDSDIISLYFSREESAISETDRKYGGNLNRIAMNVCENSSDAEECINDTYLQVWNLIPPHRPDNFFAFIAKITRNTALNLCKKRNAQKRKGEVFLLYDELEECLPSGQTPEQEFDDAEFSRHLNDFVKQLSPDGKYAFVRRYFYGDSIRDLCKQMNRSESNVKSLLYRTRKGLKEFLERTEEI